MTLRKVYMLEAFTNDGELKFRLYTRNKKTAKRIQKEHHDGKITDATDVYKEGFICSEWVD